MKITKPILLLFALLFLSGCMFGQDKKISQLPALPSIAGSEFIPCAIGGNNYYLTPSQFVTWMVLCHSYIPLGGTISGYPMHGIFEINSNSIIGDKTGHSIIFGAGNILSRSATRYGAFIANKDSAKMEHRDTIGNFQKIQQFGNKNLLTSKNAIYTNTVIQFPNVTKVTSLMNDSTNLHSQYGVRSHTDKGYVDSMDAVLGGAYIPLAGTGTNVVTGNIYLSNGNSFIHKQGNGDSAMFRFPVVPGVIHFTNYSGLDLLTNSPNGEAHIQEN